MRLFILSILICVCLGDLVGQCNINVTCRTTPAAVDCSCEIPDIPAEFIGIPADNSTDIAVFEGLGFNVTTSGPCGSLYITANDQEVHPQSCTDTFYVLRTYAFGTTAPVSITTTADCRVNVNDNPLDTFFTNIIPPHFLKGAQDSVITCKDDVTAIFQDYTDNFSYVEYLPCTGNQVLYFPTTPILASGACGASSSVRPEVRLTGLCTDICTNLPSAPSWGDAARTISNFEVLDTFKTRIECPTIAPIDVSDPDIETIITDALEDYNLFFECDRPDVVNNFDPTVLADRIIECDPQDLVLKINAIAGCPQLSDSCFVNLQLANDTPPEINFVPDTLFLECGDPLNLDNVNNWLALTRATDYRGNSVSTIGNNFDFSSLGVPYCNIGFDITFTAIDLCGRSDTGLGRVEINDTRAPEILTCPADLTVTSDDPDLSTIVNNWLNEFSATDNCNPSFTAVNDFDQNLLAFNCGQIDTVVVFTADDMCIDTDVVTCERNLTILDNVVDQFFGFPSDTTIQCENPINLPALMAWLNQVTAGNTLGTPFTVSNNFDQFDPRLLQCGETIEVEFSFDNQCSVATTRAASLNITDDILPTITCPGDITINDQNGDVELAVTAWLGTAIPQDNCSATSANAYDSFLFSDCTRDTITNPVVFWAQDGCGNRSADNCQANLTLITQKEPKITCPTPLVLECGAGNIMDTIQSWIASAIGTNFIGDDLGTNNDLILSSLDTFSCMEVTQVMFTVEDVSCSRSESCPTTITIRDTYKPTIMCPSGLTISSTSSTVDADIQAWLDSPIIEDNNCDIPSLFNDFDSSNINYCANTQPINVVFTVVDKCGEESRCAGVITVDTGAAALSCPAQDLQLECGDDTNDAQISAWLLAVSAIDNNGTDLTSDISNDFNTNSIDTSCSQTIPVEFLVTDLCTNESKCQMNVVISDSKGPEVDCTSIPTLTLLAGDTDKLPKFVNWLDLISYTDCNEVIITEDFNDDLLSGFDCNPADYDLQVTFTDDCGWITNCAANISVQNNINTSFINCTQPLDNFTVECGSDNFENDIKQWMALVSAEDNLGSTFPTSPNLDFNDPRLSECGASIPILFELVDLCGNSQDCALTLTIEDTTVPEPNCPADTTFLLESADFTVNVADWLASVAAFDNCNSIVQEQNSYSPITALDNCEAKREIDVRFTLLDGCGNSANCNSTLTVTTERVPAISCPGNRVIECGDNDTEIQINQWLSEVSGVDADNNPLVAQYDLDVDAVLAVNCDGQFPVTFTIIDNCDIEDTCSTSIIIQDTTAPDATCPPAIVINSTDPDGPQKMQDWLDSYSHTDNCSMATSSIQTGVTVPNILCNSQEERIIEFYAEDACGLRDTCESTVTINKALPEILCTGDLNLQCGEPDNDDKIVAWLETFSGMDNNGASVQPTNDFTLVNFTNECESSTEIVFTVSDNCGETSECLQLITQKDTLAPEIINCPSDVVYDIARLDINNAIDSWRSSFEAEDVCNMTTVTDDYSLILGDFDCGTDTLVTFTAVDECGNINSDCTALIAFENNLDVFITCPEDIRVKCNDGSSFGVLQDFYSGYIPDSQDPSFVVETDIVIEDLDIECTGVYTQEIIFTITDNCQNTNDCSAFIEFRPNASIYVPTIFRPGTDSENGYFSLRSNIAIENITSFRIYSRWGDLMHERENFDPNTEQGWDGRNSYGSHVQGVYTYVLIYDDIFGNTFEKVGTLTLID